MKLSFFVKLLITTLILGYFAITIGPESLVNNFSKINLNIVLISMSAFLAIIFLNSLNFKILFKPQKEFSLGLLMKKYALSWSTGFFLPSKIGEFSLIYYLRKEIEPAKASAVVFLDKLVSLLVVSLIAILGLLFLLPGLFSEMVFFGLILIVIVFIFLRQNLISSILEKIFHDKKKVKVFLETYNNYLKNHKKILVINFFITIIAWSVNSFALYLIIVNLNGSIGFFEVFFSNIATALISLIPITINGVGLKEGSFVFISGLFNLNQEIAFTAAFTFTILGYLFATLILAFKTMLMKE